MARLTRPGMRLGAWKLTGRLGKGGNAAVWLGVDESGGRAALKILLKGRWGVESYARFRDEITIMELLDGRPGVMPLLDYSKPGKPTKDDIPWHAMPVAQPMHKVFGSATDVEDRVLAIAEIAHVLAELVEENFFHRDLKPQNLFLLDETWVLGDFGLASFEEKSPLTKTGDSLGSMRYAAPEMLTDAKNADYELADVYSLAKTLWAVAIGP